MDSNTAKGSLPLSDQALLFSLDTVLAQLPTLAGQSWMRSVSQPLASLYQKIQ